jgi:hypothetical protein
MCRNGNYQRAIREKANAKYDRMRFLKIEENFRNTDNLKKYLLSIRATFPEGSLEGL